MGDSKTLTLATLAPQMAQILRLLKGLGLSVGDSKTLNLAILAPQMVQILRF